MNAEPLIVPRASFVLKIPPAKVMTTREELELTRLAVARSPGSNTLRYRLASLLMLADNFDEVISLVPAWNVREPRFLELLASAHLSRETPADDLEARRLLLSALENGADDFQTASVLAELAKAHTRLSAFDEARRCLLESLRKNPDQKNAFKRLIALDLQVGSPQNVLAKAEEMVERGVTHSRVLASRVLAFAQLGLMEEARRAQGLDEFLWQTELAPPPEWETLDGFNRDLAAEIWGHPNLRFDRYGTASDHTWRVDEPALQRSRVFPRLQELIQKEVALYVSNLQLSSHPFGAGRPLRAWLRNWTVITEGNGYETWHVHQNGWLSGVYYIHVPDHIATATGREGCIAFGLPAELIGEQRAEEFGDRLCRPRSGLLMMFPSHVYHRTFPHKGTGRRICYAFDIIPIAPTPPSRKEAFRGVDEFSLPRL
jgi:tetratricopeptide (TPR) repeat protein